MPEREEVTPISPWLAKPLNLAAHLSQPAHLGGDWVPYASLCLLAVFYLINQGRVTFSPGPGVELPRLESAQLGQPGAPVVLTVGAGGLTFFQGQKIVRAALPEVLRDFAARYPAGTPVLLKADSTLSLQELIVLLEIAREAGVLQVQIAAEPGGAAATP